MSRRPPSTLIKAPATGKRQLSKSGPSVTTQEMSAINKMRAIRECESLVEAKATQLTEKAIYLAIEKDDTAALKICMDRFWPVPKERPIEAHIPSTASVDDVVGAMQNIIQQAATGELYLSELTTLLDRLKDMKTVLMEVKELKELQERNRELLERATAFDGNAVYGEDEDME